MKGQIAFESLVILLVIVTGAATISAIYLQTHEDTLTIDAARTQILEQLSKKKELITIDYVTLDKNLTTTTLAIKTTPRTALDTVAIQKKVYSLTDLKTINIRID